MDLKKIETTTTLRALPSGHVSLHQAPTLEQTELFRVEADVFRPVTLPGEFKPRSSKRCAGFSRGFVYTVRDRSHLSPSHHQHDPNLYVDDTLSSDLFSDDQLAQRTSGFEGSFASGFDVNANSAMEKPGAGCRGSVAKTCSTLPCSRQLSIVAGRAGHVATSLLTNRSNRVHNVFRERMLEHDRDEDVCRAWDDLAEQDFTYRMTDSEYFRYKQNWWISLNKSGNNTQPVRKRSDFNQALSTLNR